MKGKGDNRAKQKTNGNSRKKTEELIKGAGEKRNIERG